jgi:hypothetical protein
MKDDDPSPLFLASCCAGIEVSEVLGQADISIKRENTDSLKWRLQHDGD